MKIAKFLDMLQNIERFSVDKSETKGMSLWFIHEGHLLAVTTDNYIAVVNSVPVDWGMPENMLLTRKDLKEYIKHFSLPDEVDELTFDEFFEFYPNMTFTEKDLQEHPEGSALMYIYETVLHVRPVEARSPVRFAVSPERIRKLGLLKPGGDYPLDFQFSFDMDSEQVLAFKYGPEIQGIVAPLDRELQDPGGLW